MSRIFDHIDLRAPSLEAVRPFYERLLPALGFTQSVEVDRWLTRGAAGDGPQPFFGIIELPDHVPNQNRIAFWAESRTEVDRLTQVVRAAGGRRIEGPDESEGEGYYAVFFEDPCGNRLEICHRFPGY